MTDAHGLEYASVTTLNRIRAAKPCEDGWCKLLAALGKTKADDEPLDLVTVLDSNGLDDALWVLSYAMPDDRLARHFQAWCAEQVLHLFEATRPDDARVRDQIAMLRRDHATPEDRDTAADAAWAAAADAVAARAHAAAWGAAWAAARNTAAEAVKDATVAAVRDTARYAPWDMVRYEARDAQLKQLRKRLFLRPFSSNFERWNP